MFNLSCKKFVEVNPPKTEIISDLVFSSDATVTSAIVGIYSQMISQSGFASGGFFSVTFLTGLSADELTSYNPGIDQFYQNALKADDIFLTYFLWSDAYKYIYTANAIMEGVNKSTAISEPVRQQVIGESKFIRAFCYFHLVNLFGDVPLDTTTDYKVNAAATREAKSKVYQQIINDLKDAQTLLSENYSFSNNERVRPNKSTATALLARVYLYTADWTNAEAQATSVINNGLYIIEPDLQKVFLKNNTESIWQLMPVQIGVNTQEASNFILTVTPPQTSALSSALLNAFEPQDGRRVVWVDSISDGSNTFYYPFKYKLLSTPEFGEYSVVFRLAEQYLIRAEANAQLNNLESSKADLNTIRLRAGLQNTLANDQASLLNAIEHERQVELFSEWGHRWFDLKRTDRADSVLTQSKGSWWQPTDALYPIPNLERQNNPNITQNPGY